jgi:hypothetical protein
MLTLAKYALNIYDDNRQGWHHSPALGFAFLACSIEFRKRESGAVGLSGYEESSKACGSS